MKILIGVHTANKNPSNTEEGWLATMVGDPATGKAGRWLTALQMGQTLNAAHNEVHVYGFVSPDQLLELVDEGEQYPKEIRALQNMLTHHAKVFGLDMKVASDLMNYCATVDWWHNVPRDRINTAGEARRLVDYAKANGFDMIAPVSTGYGHTPRVVQTVYAEAAQHDIRVWGCADTPFEGLEGALAAIVDPPHLEGAPFIRAAGKTQFHELVPQMFKVCGSDPAKYEAFAQIIERALEAMAKPA